MTDIRGFPADAGAKERRSQSSQNRALCVTFRVIDLNRCFAQACKCS